MVSSQEQVDSLEAYIIELQDEAVSLSTEVDATRVLNVELSKEYRVLRKKLSSIKREILEYQNNEHAVRHDLATRLHAADQRERSLKLREMAVNQTEKQLQANSSLLNL